ncbi:mitochondrial carrier protein CoAc1 [Vigna radiata var. radiata]|uniref:Mitochondrial carrier protein CoAc1 n=1 Tax=Vigna radiata var. radiata TaxID=3916 RepID=A0A1S3U6G9_VIGRR|nr:mitochondrial carrier protein CoAc1 [Vigna radiata var. radiata]
MDSSQGSTIAGFVDNASIQRKQSSFDGVPVYVKELIAGGFAGALSKTAVAPLERVKILWQTRTPGFHSLGVYQSLNKLVKREGFQGLYKGNGAGVIRIVPYAALHFMTYERYKSWILNNYPMLGSGPCIDLLAGSAAGGTSVLCTYPLDLARTKLAYQVVDTRGGIKDDGMRGVQRTNNGIKGVLTSVYKEGGARGLYRGAGPTLTGILPYAGLKFYMYEKLKTYVPEEHQKSIVMRLSCGALAGLFGQTLTYPLDVVKRQMQVGSLQNATHENVRYKNTIDGLRTIVRNQGWRQLFHGVSINYIRIVPSAAISFTTYDMMKSWLGIPPQQQKSRSVSAA